jgi:alanine racemase
MANSSGLIHGKDTVCTMARPGIAVYGIYPDSDACEVVNLVPSMSMTSRIASVRSMPAGYSTGYGATYTFSRDAVVAVIKTGYDNGYPRTLSNRADVLVNGIRCPVVGRICMKAMVVDVSFAGKVKEDDNVVLIGHQHDSLIRPEEVAEWAGTISYEILCMAGRVNKRVYTGV